jgi:hypothetical protein
VKRNVTIPVTALLSAIVSVSAGFPCGAAAAASLGPEASSAVQVTAVTPSLRGSGKGTIVAIAGERIRVITAKHVAVFGRLSVKFESGSSVPARIVSLAAGRDVAVIEAIVPLSISRQLRAAPIGAARAHEVVHVGGAGSQAGASESASVTEVGGKMPDGPAKGRYKLACARCHIGDSGAGVLDKKGDLVGIYVGYFTYDSGARVGVAETPGSMAPVADTAPSTESPVAGLVIP